MNQPKQPLGLCFPQVPPHCAILRMPEVLEINIWSNSTIFRDEELKLWV